MALVNEIEALISREAFSAQTPADEEHIKSGFPFNRRPVHEGEELLILRRALALLIDVDVNGAATRNVRETWSKLRKLLLSMPVCHSELTLSNADARATPVPSNLIDLVITSPPYVNVFNYHQQYRFSAEKLGWNPLATAVSEISSNRKHRQNRFLTVIQYCLDMAQVFLEMARVCKDNARLIFVVGKESRVRGIPFYNSGIIAQLAVTSAHFDIEKRSQRVFKNRFGDNITEDVLHLRKRGLNLLVNNSFEESRQIGKQALLEALVDAATDTRGDVLNAIAQSHQVLPSPILGSKMGALHDM